MKEEQGPTQFNAPLWSLPVLGGSPIRLANTVGRDGAWSPDGKQLAYTWLHDLYLANADGTGSHKLASLSSGGGVPVWSPDGKQIRVTVGGAEFGTLTSIWQVAPSGADLHPLFPGWHARAGMCCGVWSPDGQYFVFPTTGPALAIHEGMSLLHKADPAPVQLTSGAIGYLDPSAAEGWHEIYAIEVLRRRTGEYNQKAAALAPYLGGNSAYYLDFSRDGQSLVYVTYPDQTLWRSNVDGSGSFQLTSPPLNVLEPRWSPDGKQIVVLRLGARQAATALYRLSDGSGTPEELAPSSPGQQWDPTWSPDGKSVMFGDLPGPQSVIRIVDVGTRQVSIVPGSQGFFSPRWSPDGRYIAALPNGSKGLVLYDFKTEKWSPLASDPVRISGLVARQPVCVFSKLPGGERCIDARQNRRSETGARDNPERRSSGWVLWQLARPHARQHPAHPERCRHRRRGFDGLERAVKVELLNATARRPQGPWASLGA